MDGSFLLNPSEVIAHFGVKENVGLSEGQVDELRKIHGANGLFPSTRKVAFVLID